MPRIFRFRWCQRSAYGERNLSTPSESISFRLSAELLRKLDKKRDPFGDSRGEYSKRIVMADLLRQQDDSDAQQILELRQAVALVDDDLQEHSDAVLTAVRRLAFAVLTSTRPLPSDEAREIVRQIAPSIIRGA